MSSSSNSGGSRVLIPSSVRKTIHDIKEIAAKHSDEDIYLMLKECNMDPDETAQRLLYLGIIRIFSVHVYTSIHLYV